jgi:Domain of unknown function (DUF1996)
MTRQSRRAQARSRRKRLLGVAMGVVLAAGFAAGIRVASATESTDPDILALMAQVPNDETPGTCDVPKATASPAKAAEPKSPKSSDSKSPKSSDSKSPKSSDSKSADSKDAKLPAGCDHHGAEGGPLASDFINITKVTARVREATPDRDGSRGTFLSACGRNEDNHRNPDNFIVAPGVSNGAHHVHDYVGNRSTDGFSTNDSLAAAGTTCRGGDQSAYFWPVLRYRSNAGSDANAPGGGQDGNVGIILRPESVRLQFRGNAKAKVRAMPKFLRIITGDAKAGTNGVANAKAAWTCTGFEDRTTVKYPICPQGSKVERILDFASCWDGKNTDSTNHRSHVVFPRNDGSCWDKTVPVPQLRMTLTYSIPARALFALDTFPEQKHNPLTDHADFTNLMPDKLMRLAVECINTGHDCDAGGVLDNSGAGSPAPSTSGPGQMVASNPPKQSPPSSPSRSHPANGSTGSRESAPRNDTGQQNQGQPGTGGTTRANPPDAGNANPPGANPPGANPPAVNPPAVNPPAADPPAADPPAADPQPAADNGGVIGGGAGNGPAAGNGAATGGDPEPAARPAADADSAAPAEELPAEGAASDLTEPPPTEPTGAAATKRAGGSRNMLYAVNGVALATLGGWLVMLFRRRRLR